MSVQAMSWVFEHSESRLGPRHVLLSIANHTDRLGKKAWPSKKTIAREARLSEREVQYAISILVEMGELEVSYGQGPGGTFSTTLYSLPKMDRGANFAGRAESEKRGANSSSPIRKNRPKQPSLETLPACKTRMRDDWQDLVSIAEEFGIDTRDRENRGLIRKLGETAAGLVTFRELLDAAVKVCGRPKRRRHSAGRRLLFAALNLTQKLDPYGLPMEAA